MCWEACRETHNNNDDDDDKYNDNTRRLPAALLSQSVRAYPLPCVFRAWNSRAAGVTCEMEWKEQRLVKR